MSSKNQMASRTEFVSFLQWVAFIWPLDIYSNIVLFGFRNSGMF